MPVQPKPERNPVELPDLLLEMLHMAYKSPQRHSSRSETADFRYPRAALRRLLSVTRPPCQCQHGARRSEIGPLDDLKQETRKRIVCLGVGGINITPKTSTVNAVSPNTTVVYKLKHTW